MPDADGRVWPAKLADVVERARDRFGVPTVSVSDRGGLPPGTIVVDVRTGPETQVSIIEGARRLEDEAAREAFLASPPDAPVLVYCTAGWRSAEFTRDLRAAGVEAWNLEGGVCAWALYGQPIIGADGQPTKRIHGFDEDWAACVPDGYEAVW